MAIEPFIEKLTEMTDPEAGDFVSAFDNDAPAGDKDRKLNLSRLALLAQANTFLANQRFNALIGVDTAPTTSAQIFVQSASAARAAAIFRAAASPSAPVFRVEDNAGNLLFGVGGNASFSPENVMFTTAFNNGAGVGRRLFLHRNSNASTPASGVIQITNRGNTDYRIWPDASGNLRIGTTDPTSANDTSGTVVGTQTSAAATKDIDAELPDWRESINYIVEAVQGGALRSWKYKSGAYNNEHYPIGIVTDYSPRYGQDKGRSLNIPVAIGDLMGAVVWLAERVAELEAKDG